MHFNSYAALLEGLRKIATDTATADAKAKVIQALVHQVEVKKGGTRVHFYAGDQEIRRAKEGPRRGLFESEKNPLSDGSKSLCKWSG